MRVLTPKIKIAISNRDFLKMISKIEVSIKSQVSMGTPNIERNFDFQHNFDIWNNVSISKIEIFIFKMNFLKNQMNFEFSESSVVMI